jgi:hypothetical protein
MYILIDGKPEHAVLPDGTDCVFIGDQTMLRATSGVDNVRLFSPVSAEPSEQWPPTHSPK